ncbi:MAG TPA: helix-turn-helix transcriptional regulator [Afifellaceae bacterium]|nr:helix-turn-helix transcriptional regulator [Afifellaceae bacterium]
MPHAKSAGLTQGEVARRLHRPQSFVAKYEGGERRIDVVEFIAIAQALGRDPRDVFDELVRSSEASRRRQPGRL